MFVKMKIKMKKKSGWVFQNNLIPGPNDSLKKLENHPIQRLAYIGVC
jgi:hypothetical protein